MSIELILWIFLGCFLILVIVGTVRCERRGQPRTFWCQVLRGLRGDFRP